MVEKQDDFDFALLPLIRTDERQKSAVSRPVTGIGSGVGAGDLFDLLRQWGPIQSLKQVRANDQSNAIASGENSSSPHGRQQGEWFVTFVDEEAGCRWEADWSQCEGEVGQVYVQFHAAT